MLKIDPEPKLDFDDVFIKPIPTELSSRSEVNLNVSYVTKHSKKVISGLPVLVANMDKIATPNMAKTLHRYGIGVCLHKHIDREILIDFFKKPESEYCFVTHGLKDDLSILKDIQPQKICLDVANGYMYSFLDYIKSVRCMFQNSIIMAGNVCTPEGVENIIKAGADIVKCGIAQGGKCDTKNKAGVGYKQLSVAIECGQAANELNALCCSDGGIKKPADIVKCLGGGSHFVMSGSLFFGYKENDTEWIEDMDGKRMLSYGMSSKIANEKFYGGLQEYRTSEGKEEMVNYKGSVIELAQDIRGGLSSGCTYTNTKNLENLKKNCFFVRNN